jgi:hypothetical protein
MGVDLKSLLVCIVQYTVYKLLLDEAEKRKRDDRYSADMDQPLKILSPEYL